MKLILVNIYIPILLLKCHLISLSKSSFHWGGILQQNFSILLYPPPISTSLISMSIPYPLLYTSSPLTLVTQLSCIQHLIFHTLKRIPLSPISNTCPTFLLCSYFHILSLLVYFLTLHFYCSPNSNLALSLWEGASTWHHYSKDLEEPVRSPERVS